MEETNSVVEAEVTGTGRVEGEEGGAAAKLRTETDSTGGEIVV